MANGPGSKPQRNADVAEKSLEKRVVVESHDVRNARPKMAVKGQQNGVMVEKTAQKRSATGLGVGKCRKISF
jgi:hypothetical protein